MHECKQKLYTWGFWGNEADEIINALSEENYLNETRFAEAYTRGKFYYKDWGRNRILFELKQRKISAYNITKGLKEINEDDYKATILKLFYKKMSAYSGKGLKDYQKKIKAQNFIIQKGFEYNVVQDVLSSF